MHHCAEGRVLRALETKYLDAVRHYLGPRSGRKALLRSGDIVVQIFAASRCDGGFFEAEDVPTSSWYHIGLHYFSPVRSTFQRLQLPPHVDLSAWHFGERPLPLQVS